VWRATSNTFSMEMVSFFSPQVLHLIMQYIC
jgi:hypothetical protein